MVKLGEETGSFVYNNEENYEEREDYYYGEMEENQ